LAVVDASMSFSLHATYNLRDYQEEAKDKLLEILKDDYGQALLSAGTGSGKTYSMAKIVESLGQRTLILSHLSMLSSQMFSEMSKNLIGSIKILDTKDLEKPLPDIAICTFQLLDSNKELLNKLKEYYGLVIVDEAENCFTRSRLRILFTLKPKYQIYLTATPTRELMKQTSGLQYLFGDKVVVMSPPEEHKIHSKHMFIDYRPMFWQSPQNTNLYKTTLGKFFMKSRVLQDIAIWCKELKSQGVKGTFWVVVDLNAVQDKLEELMVNQGLRVAIIRGTTSQKKRQQILVDIHEQKLDIILGSAPLSAGLSIPELSVGIRLMPNSSSDELLEQMRGRLNRFIGFKQTQSPIWIDFLIGGSLEYGAKKRYNLYHKTTYGVTISKPDVAVSNIIKEVNGN
jgi:superfamily II DNA or RNA helicase